jgi:YD repeat-containing protein
MRGTVRCPPFRMLAHCDLSTPQNGTYEMKLTAPAGFVTTNTSVLFALDSNLKIDALGRVSEQYDFKKQRKLVRYDRLGRVATNFWFESASDYPSNSTEYYYNALGQLTNITERAGTDASSTYFVSSVPLLAIATVILHGSRLCAESLRRFKAECQASRSQCSRRLDCCYRGCVCSAA